MHIIHHMPENANHTPFVRNLLSITKSADLSREYSQYISGLTLVHPSAILSVRNFDFLSDAIRLPFACFMVFDAFFAFTVSYAALFPAWTFVCFFDPHFYLRSLPWFIP